MFPERVAGVISFDTAPKPSPPEARKATERTIDQIASINIQGSTRKSAMDQVEKLFPDRGIANFITNNLIYEGEGQDEHVAWCCNLKAIKANAGNIADYPGCSDQALEEEGAVPAFSGI